jgi:putative DNA primase/helicase
MDALRQFRDAMQRAGLAPPDEIIADGDLHRFSSNGKPSDTAGWYVAYSDGIPAGSFGDWRTGLTETWRADLGRVLTDVEREEQRQRIDAARRKREQAEKELRADAKRRAEEEWANAHTARSGHPYLKRKGVKPWGIREDGKGRLLVPLYDSSASLQSLQYITPDGEKRFLPGGRTSGCYFPIGGKPTDVLCIAEGFATAATIVEATGYPVAVAFNCGNLEPVAHVLREKLPEARLIVCADDDAETVRNPGLTKAKQAASAVGGLVAIPDFGADRPSRATDFNDLAAHRGLDAVRACIESAAAPECTGWPEPLPLVADMEPEPYPVEVLPGDIGRAVREVAAFVQCPVALAACSALSALSVAAQGLVNVKRGCDLIGPVSLALLAIAESGERKSECDRRFADVLSDWQAEQATSMQADLAAYRAEQAAWEAEREALLTRFKQARKKGETVEEARSELERLEFDRPTPIRVPRILLESETAESLAWHLAKPDGWPTGGILSSEAGIVFGGHAMRRDTIVQSLSLLNKLWSGEPVRVGRRTSETYDLVGGRLTLGLAVQPETVLTFFNDSHGLARGTGFLARFLIAWPESTQGTRMYCDPPSGWPGLNAYKARLRQLLEVPLSMDEAGRLAPRALDMSPEAFEGWRRFHDMAETELRQGGELAELRDVASKAAENVARLAALFHVCQ